MGVRMVSARTVLPVANAICLESRERQDMMRTLGRQCSAPQMETYEPHKGVYLGHAFIVLKQSVHLLDTRIQHHLPRNCIFALFDAQELGLGHVEGALLECRSIRC